MRVMEDHAKLDSPPTFLVRIFVTPCVNTKPFSERSFSYSGPFVWNSFTRVPILWFCFLDSASSFKTALKTWLFSVYSPPSPHFCFLCGKCGSWRKINSQVFQINKSGGWIALKNKMNNFQLGTCLDDDTGKMGSDIMVNEMYLRMLNGHRRTYSTRAGYSTFKVIAVWCVPWKPNLWFYVALI